MALMGFRISRTLTTSIMNLLVICVNGFLSLIYVTKNFILDASGVLDSVLILLGELFPKKLSVKRNIPMPDSEHGETVGVARSVLFKIIARKDIIFSEYFRVPLIYRQVLIFNDKFYQFFYSMHVFEM